MTDLLFTASEATSGGEEVNADLYVQALRARCISPSDLGAVPQTSPKLTVRQEDTANRDIEIQVSAVSNFASTIWTTTLTNIAPLTDTSISIGITLTDRVKYYWRCRAVDTSGPTYGAWESRSFTVVMVNGSDYQSVMMSGTWTWTLFPLADYEPVMANLGANLTLFPLADYEPIYSNLGAAFTLYRGDYAMGFSGDVNTLPPDPDIWFLLPTSGRAGDGFVIIGSGFGDLQSTYTGTVEVDLNDGFGWQTIGVITWQTFPADPDMYGPNREISVSKIDPEHGEIAVLVPNGATPPGMRVRVRTVA